MPTSDPEEAPPAIRSPGAPTEAPARTLPSVTTIAQVHAGLTVPPGALTPPAPFLRHVVEQIEAGQLAGWSADPACWRPLIDAMEGVGPSAFHRDTRINLTLGRLLWQIAGDPALTDEGVAEVWAQATRWAEILDIATRQRAPWTTLQARLLHHPAAGVAVQAQLVRLAEAFPYVWVDLPAVRPDWITAPIIQRALEDLARATWNVAGGVDTPWGRLVLTHASASAAAAFWQASLTTRGNVPAHLAALAFLSADAVALVGVTTHDLVQCLTHAPTPEAHFGILAALQHLPVDTDAAEPPVADVRPVVYADLAPPDIPAAFAAHHPAIRAWLATRAPGVATYDETVRVRHSEAEAKAAAVRRGWRTRGRRS